MLMSITINALKVNVFSFCQAMLVLELNAQSFFLEVSFLADPHVWMYCSVNAIMVANLLFLHDIMQDDRFE